MDTGPEMIVVCGLPGVGKSRVARLLAERLPGTTIHRTDVVRKELVDEPEYTTEETERVYQAIRRRARETVAGDGRAVLDGTFRTQSLRADVAATADEMGVDLQFLHVECEEEIVRERIAERTGGVSDAAFDEYLLLKSEFDEFVRPHATVDNSGSWDRTRERVLDVFAEATSEPQ